MSYNGKMVRLSVLGVCLALGVTILAKSAFCASKPIVSNLAPITDGASTPVRILADASGNYFVSDPRGGGIVKYDKNGKRLAVYTAVKDVIGMAFAQNGELLVTHGETVVRLNAATGSVLGTFGVFKKAHGIAVDASGNVYVTDSTDDCVQKFNSAYAPVTIATASPGKPSNSFGATGSFNGQFKRPAGITYDKSSSGPTSGQLAVADSLNGRVQFFTTNGVWASNLGSFGTGPSKFTMPKSLAIEYAGGMVNRYYVVDSFQSNIQVFDSSKGYLDKLGKYGYGQGDLVSPSDVVVDQSSTLTPALLVANEIGMVTRYGIDSLQPTNIQVQPATVAGQLTLTWTNPDPAITTFSAVNIYQSPIADVLGTKVGSNVLGSSFTSTGLIANTTYYYTVRGVSNTSAETTNTDQHSGKTLIYYTLTATALGMANDSGSVGGGTISSDLPAPGLTSSNGVYTAPVKSGTVVTLMPTRDAYSIFKGWSGDVCNNQPSGNCVFTLDKAVNVTAKFEAQHKFKIASRAIYADILQDIYAQALAGDTIMAMSGSAPAFGGGYNSMTANSNVTVTVIGGYDSEYASSTGYTTMQGRVNIKSGKVVFKNIKVK